MIDMKQTTGWGVGVPNRVIAAHGMWLAEAVHDLLRPQCWFNWSDNPRIERPGYFPMVYRDMRPAVRERMMARPGETWLLFNEPERADQANIAPAEAVGVTKEFLTTAWATGNPFRWAAPGVSMQTDDGFDGLAWLSEYMAPPGGLRGQGITRPNYWHFHPYRSGSVRHVRASWDSWQGWYRDRGGGVPVIISEVCAENSPLDDQKAVMRWARDRLETGEAMAVMWFCSHQTSSGNWPRCWLVDFDPVKKRAWLNELGKYWLSLRGAA